MTAESPSSPLPTDAELDARLAAVSTPADAEEFVALAPRLAGIGRAHIALRLAQRAAEVAERQGDLPLRIRALRVRARSQSELAEYTGVVRSLLEAQSINREVGDPEQELRILSVLGMAYGKLGARADAIASHEAALKISAGRGAEVEAECYGNLGITLLNCERMVESVAMLRRAKARADEGSDTMIKLRARVNLNAARAAAADWQLRRGPDPGAIAELRATLEDCESTLQECRAADIEAFELPVMEHIAIIHRLLGELDVAASRFAEVTARARERGWKRLEFDVLLHVGGLHASAGEFAAAEEALDRVLAYYEASENKLSILEAHLERAKLYELMGAYDKAYAALRSHNLLRLDMAASEESLRVLVQGWRDEYDALQRNAQEAEHAAAALANQNAALVEQNKSLGHEASHDALTGLANRRFGDQWLAEQFALHAAGNRVLALAIVDFDHFKTINDRFSHLSGDAVLRVAADLLRNVCRESDLAIRFGGDEFVVVFSDTTAAQAETICERICTQIGNHPWESIGHGLAVTATIGIADSFGVASVADLLHAADQRLYLAKEAGRNRVA